VICDKKHKRCSIAPWATGSWQLVADRRLVCRSAQVSSAEGGSCKQGALKKKNPKNGGTYLPTFFLRFFEIFRSDFRKYFYGVFGLLMQRNGQKRDKKIRWEKTKGKNFFFSTFSAKSF
jgi:hypothetical protein